ncbi:hypothetical protein ACWD4G_12200 [Streptomyces sp. NPDC002643]
MTTGSGTDGGGGGNGDHGYGGGARRQAGRTLAAWGAAVGLALSLTGCAGSGLGVRDEGPSRRPPGEALLDAEVVEGEPVPGARSNGSKGSGC